MIRLILSCFVFFLFFCSVVFAHPPSDIKIDYDKDSGILHIEMRHVTQNMREHHIRKLIVSKNGKQINSIVVVKQESPSYHKVDIRVSAEGEDELSVKAICNDGGIGRASVVVPKDEEIEEENLEVKTDDVSTGE